MPRRSNLKEKILSILFENPTVTREEIKERLGVSYQAIQKHLSSMKEQKIVVPSFSVAELNIKKKYRFWVFIVTNSPSLEKKDGEQSDYQRKLCNSITKSFYGDSNLSNLVDGLIFGGVDIVIGGTPDIILRLLSDNPDSVGDYVTRFLRNQPAVVSTSTAWSLTKSSIEST